jgi:hypothetical protein
MNSSQTLYSRTWIDKLVQAGWLNPDRRHDAQAIKEATERRQHSMKVVEPNPTPPSAA